MFINFIPNPIVTSTSISKTNPCEKSEKIKRLGHIYIYRRFQANLLHHQNIKFPQARGYIFISINTIIYQKCNPPYKSYVKYK